MNNPGEDNLPIDKKTKEDNDEMEIFYDAVEEIDTDTSEENEEIDNNVYEVTSLSYKKKEDLKDGHSDLMKILSNGSFGKYLEDFYTGPNVDRSKDGDFDSVCLIDEKKKTKTFLLEENVKRFMSTEQVEGMPKKTGVYEKAPLHGRLVTSIFDFFNCSKGIAHFAVRREKLGYFHHYIVMGWNNTERKIIEYTVCFSNIPCIIRGIEVVERDLSEDEINHSLREKNLYIIEAPNYPKTEEEMENAKSRYLERLGENKYGAAYNNCEHLVSYILTGDPRSEQIIVSKSWQLILIDTVQTVVVDFETRFLTIVGYTFATVPSFFFDLNIDRAILSIKWTSGSFKSEPSNGGTRNFIDGATFLVRGALEGALIAAKLEEINKMKNLNHINKEDFEREERKIRYGSYGHALGGAVGELVSPIPGVGYAVGSTTGNIAGRLLSSLDFFLCPRCGNIHPMIKS